MNKDYNKEAMQQFCKDIYIKVKFRQIKINFFKTFYQLFNLK